MVCTWLWAQRTPDSKLMVIKARLQWSGPTRSRIGERWEIKLNQSLIVHRESGGDLLKELRISNQLSMVYCFGRGYFIDYRSLILKSLDYCGRVESGERARLIFENLSGCRLFNRSQQSHFNYQWCIAFAEDVSSTRLNQPLIVNRYERKRFVHFCASLNLKDQFNYSLGYTNE